MLSRCGKGGTPVDQQSVLAILIDNIGVNPESRSRRTYQCGNSSLMPCPITSQNSKYASPLIRIALGIILTKRRVVRSFLDVGTENIPYPDSPIIRG